MTGSEGTRNRPSVLYGDFLFRYWSTSPELAAVYKRARERRDRRVARYRRRAAMAKTMPLPFKHRNRGWRRRG